MYNLNETSIISNFMQATYNRGYRIPDESMAEDFYKTFFYATSEFLGLAKNKSTKVALALKDLKGNLKLAGVVAYHANEDETKPGNWSYEITTDEADLEGATVYLSTDTQFQKILTETSLKQFKISLEGGPAIAQALMESSIDILLQWLDVNAKEGEVVEVGDDKYFVASVAIEEGQKVISIVPGSEMKVFIKSDAIIEK